MPLITVTHRVGNKYFVPKAKLIEMFLTSNGINTNLLQSFYYDTTTDSLVFELNDVVTNENVNYSSGDLINP